MILSINLSGMTVNESILDSYGIELETLDSEWRKSIELVLINQEKYHNHYNKK